MKKSIVALGLAAALTGCSASAQMDMQSQPAVEELKAEIKGLDGLSREKIGYGQGVEVDEYNVPVGALNAQNEYGSLGLITMNKDDRISLTFDQGYENGYTAKILDTLKEKGVKATFFVVQDYAERNPELVQRMIDEGHIIGNHSVHHLSMPELDYDKCREEIMGFHEYMLENFNYEMNLFRPPMGEFSEYSLAAAKECGYDTVLWSFAYADWDTNAQPDPDTALDKIVSAAHKGEICLLHSVSETNAEILGQVIDSIRAAGFEFNEL
ncbi:MAG: polysaccharide deacetylase family protein [Ruminococcus sp.]|nr:polysaccharide deacetylase family protein [Ruminococcus sp.]